MTLVHVILYDISSYVFHEKARQHKLTDNDKSIACILVNLTSAALLMVQLYHVGSQKLLEYARVADKVAP